MKKAWSSAGSDLIKGINQIMEGRESVTELGKDAISWSNVANRWNPYLGKTR